MIVKCFQQALCLLTLGACAAPVGPVPTVASARVVGDFDTYQLSRVGVLPVTGLPLTNGLAGILQSALAAEFVATGSIEWVVLTEAELSGIEGFEPHLRGGYPAESILVLSSRHRLDGLLVPTVTDRQSHSPQRLGVQTVLLSAETGMSLWQAEVQLDAADERTRLVAERFVHRRGGDLSSDHWEMVLLSPRRFACIAASQLAKVF